MTDIGWYVVLHDVKLEDTGFNKMFSTLLPPEHLQYQ